MQIILSVVLCLLIIGVNAAIILKTKSYANPALVLSVFFGAQMLLSLFFLQQDMGGIYYGFFWMIAGMSVFALGSYGMRVRQNAKPRIERGAGFAHVPKGYGIYDSRPMQVTLGALLLLSFAQPLSLVYRLGYSFKDLFSLQKLLEINSTVANDRYISGDFATSALTQVFLVLVYLLPLMGGWNFIYSKKAVTKILCGCTVLPSLFVLFTQNTKAAFIGSVLLFLCSFVTAKIQRSGSFFKFRVKHLLLLIPLAAVFLIFNYVSFFLREGDVSWSLFEAINNKVLNYLLGQIPAFNYWFSNNLTLPAHTFGLKTFYSVSDTLGLMKRIPGIYSVKLVTAHLNTNVYTAFRPLIEDFSAFGALIVLFLTGALSGFCFERLRAGRARCVDIAFLTALYFYIFYAFITSPWAYVSYTAAVVLFLCYLLVMRKHIIFIREPQ
jgi:oligosaccharide repeat unit polymerase